LPRCNFADLETMRIGCSTCRRGAASSGALLYEDVLDGAPTALRLPRELVAVLNIRELTAAACGWAVFAETVCDVSTDTMAARDFLNLG